MLDNLTCDYMMDLIGALTMQVAWLLCISMGSWLIFASNTRLYSKSNTTNLQQQ